MQDTVTVEILNSLAPEEVVLIQAYRNSSDLDRRTIHALLSLLLKSLIEPSTPSNVVELSEHRRAMT